MKRKRKILLAVLGVCVALICSGCVRDNVQMEAENEEQIVGEVPVSESRALPVMEITCKSKYDSGSLYTYQDCEISLNGVSYEGNEMEADGLSGKLKYRGNSTLNRPKKSFRLKLSEKQNLFGMGKSRQWVLLANDIDHTQMRNILLNQFAYDLGSEVKIDSVSVDLYFNGEYQGIYQLCEHVRIGKNRVEITDWEDIAEDAAEAIVKREKLGEDAQEKLEDALKAGYAWIDEPHEFSFQDRIYMISDYVTIPARTGGFLLEMDFYAYEDSSLAKLISAYRLPLYFNTPEPTQVGYFKNTSLYQYAQRYMQSFEYALHADDFYYRDSDAHYKTTRTGRFSWSRMTWVDVEYAEADYSDVENDGKHYSDFFDMDSLVNNFIFCEYAMNWDSMKNSFFVYKDVDELAQIAPQWDFDWCWGNHNMYGIDTNYPENWHTTIDYFTNEQYYQTQQYNRMLIHDPYFLARAYEKYHEIRPTLIEEMIREGGTIDSYADYLRESAGKNDDRWKNTYRSYRGQTFTLAVNQMKTFLDKRVNWLDEQFTDFDGFVDSLGKYQRSRFVTMEEPEWQEDGSVRIRAAYSNAPGLFCFVLNGTERRIVPAENGVAEVTFAASELDSGHLNVVVAMEMDSDGNYLYNDAAGVPGDYNIVSSNYVLLE